MIDTIYIHEIKNPDEVEPSGFSWDLPVKTVLYFFDRWEKAREEEKLKKVIKSKTQKGRKF